MGSKLSRTIKLPAFLDFLASSQIDRIEVSYEGMEQILVMFGPTARNVKISR